MHIVTLINEGAHNLYKLSVSTIHFLKDCSTEAEWGKD